MADNRYCDILLKEKEGELWTISFRQEMTTSSVLDL